MLFLFLLLAFLNNFPGGFQAEVAILCTEGNGWGEHRPDLGHLQLHSCTHSPDILLLPEQFSPEGLLSLTETGFCRQHCLVQFYSLGSTQRQPAEGASGD